MDHGTGMLLWSNLSCKRYVKYPELIACRKRQETTSDHQVLTVQIVDPSIGIKRQDTAARKLFAELSALPGPLEFVRAVIPDTTATFGSVTSEDIAEKLGEYEVILDKRLVLSEKIKTLGQHQVSIKCGESQVNIDVIVKSS